MEPIDIEAVKESYRKLERASANLNACSDALNAVVADINIKLKELNLGISFWHTWANTEAGGNAVGYARVNGKWGLAIKQFKNATNDTRYTEEVWLMQDAPRWMRIEAISLLPNLIETGILRTEEICAKIVKAGEKAKEIVESITQVGTDAAS